MTTSLWDIRLLSENSPGLVVVMIWGHRDDGFLVIVGRPGGREYVGEDSTSFVHVLRVLFISIFLSIIIISARSESS